MDRVSDMQISYEMVSIAHVRQLCPFKLGNDIENFRQHFLNIKRQEIKAKLFLQAGHFLKCIVWLLCRENFFSFPQKSSRMLPNFENLFDCSVIHSISFIFFTSHLLLINHDMLIHFLLFSRLHPWRLRSLLLWQNIQKHSWRTSG